MRDFTEPYEVLRLLGDLPCQWGIAGGWAVDLFLDRVTRDHNDVEVAIIRNDQMAFRQYLSARDWSFEQVVDGRFRPWSAEERLTLPIHEIWCQRVGGTLQQLEVLLNECSKDAFLFRRNPGITLPIERTFLRSNSGIPILAPEIVLLYKSKRAFERKEQLDFFRTLGVLDVERRRWLSEGIAVIDPEHAWLAALKSPNPANAS